MASPFVKCTGLSRLRLLYNNTDLLSQDRTWSNVKRDSFHITSEFLPMHTMGNRRGLKKRKKKKLKKKGGGRKNRTKCLKNFIHLPA